MITQFLMTLLFSLLYSAFYSNNVVCTILILSLLKIKYGFFKYLSRDSPRVIFSAIFFSVKLHARCFNRKKTFRNDFARTIRANYYSNLNCCSGYWWKTYGLFECVFGIHCIVIYTFLYCTFLQFWCRNHNILSWLQFEETNNEKITW